MESLNHANVLDVYLETFVWFMYVIGSCTLSFYENVFLLHSWFFTAAAPGSPSPYLQMAFMIGELPL